MADYTTNVVGVSMIVWDGTNVDAIRTFIGASLVHLNGTQLEVNGKDVPTGYSIAKSGGVFYGVFSPAHVAANFTQV